MCGRFVGYLNVGDYQQHFPIDRIDAEVAPNYNVAPTQRIPVIVRHEGQNVLRLFQWGLVPFWAKDPAIGGRMINARSETVDSKPAFRNAFKKHRCLIPANGFYEWQGPKGAKQPMYITLPDETPFAFAGLWDIWDDKGNAEQPLFSCAILTTGASPALETIHQRMPVILTPDAYQGWLAEDTPDSVLKDVLDRQTHKNFAFRPVSKAVNSAKHNSADLIKPDHAAG